MSHLSTTTSAASLSTRGRSLAHNPARADMALFMEAAQDAYHPQNNPQGKFPLNVAENSPMIPVVQARLAATLQRHVPPAWVFQYTQIAGHPEVRAAVAQFMTRYLCQCPIEPDTLGLSAGASAIVELTSFLLANPGEVAAIPAPAYPMYSHDLGVKSGLARYDLQTHVELNEHGAEGPVTPARMDQALADLRSQGKRLKLLLLTTPDNPTGCMYALPRLRELAQWCMQHEVHLVVNEIYGLSVLPGQVPADSGSFATLMREYQSDYLHLWYALSKDFAMSGLRVGVLHSRNEALMTAFANANIPHMVSNLTQWVVGEMLQDEAFLQDYLAHNQRQLAESYRVITEALDAWGVPYLPASGSLFVWADFSRYLAAPTEAAEQDFWLDLYRQTGVLLTPGAGFQHQKHGLFRIVHTAVPTEHLAVAVARMQAFLDRKPGN